MELIFLGTEPGQVAISSLVAKTNDTTLLIDCGPEFLNQINREKLSEIDFLLFTHAGNDSIGGLPQLKEWLAKKEIDSILAFMEKETYDHIKQEFKDINFLDIKFFSPGVPFTINNIRIEPFRVINSVQDLSVAGFRFLDIVYSAGEIPPESKHCYQNADVIIYDAVTWFGQQVKGCRNAADALKFAKELKPKQFVMTQAGATYPARDESEQKINQYWKEIGGDKDTKVHLAYNGLRLILMEHVSQVLSEAREGIYLTRPHASMIYTGEKELVIKGKSYRNKINRLLYLIEDSLCFGIIRLKNPDKINLKEFVELESKHKISEEDRKKWWPFKEILYSYGFDAVELFGVPRRVDVAQDAETFVKDFKFLDEQQFIQDAKSYDPQKLDTAILRDDWRIINAWYASKKMGKKIKHSLEDIINLARLAYLELKKRNTSFHPDKMKPYSKELYDIVSGYEMSIADLSNPSLLGELKDKTIIKDFISICGSYATGKKEPNDIDVLIRMTEPSDYIRRAIEVRFLKELGWSDKVHFIWGDPEGPHDTFIPIYDLAITRIKPLKIIRMTEELIELSSSALFYPMKPSKRFYQADEAVEYMFESGSGKYAIEKKFNGLRAVLYKMGNSIRIYSDQKNDISRHFQTILNEAKGLSNKDFIIDSELVLEGGGRSQIAKYITGKEDLDDSKIELHAFDCIYLGEDLSHLPWAERKSHLHSFKFSKHIKEVPSIIISTPPEAGKAINFLRNLKGSEGAMIKRYDGVYTKNGETDAWIKFRNEDTIVARVMEVSSKEGGHTFLMGIKPPKNANEKFIQDGYLILGNTFVTQEEANVGDHIEVNIEETWRHTYPKDNSIRYSIHKPRVIKATNSPLTSWEKLDELAVSKGEEVIENEELDATTTSTPGISEVQGKKWKKKIIEGPKGGSLQAGDYDDDEDREEEQEMQGQEGGEPSVNNFPERMQRNFKDVLDSGKWMPFTMQWHLRGEKSIHTDLRLDTGDVLEGFTLFTPGSVDGEDLLMADPHNIRGTIKVPQPKEWLKVEGGCPRGDPGTTTKHNAYFAIVDKGMYRPIEIDDHKITFELKSDLGKINRIKPIAEDDKSAVDGFNGKLPEHYKDLNGCFSYHIAHIGINHLILFDKLKECPGD
jgi:phosphoribosyl 1,2-cyclic phosphate phosphodiesterase